MDDTAPLEVGAVPRRRRVERQVELEDAAAVPEAADACEERRRQVFGADHAKEQAGRSGIGEDRPASP